MMDGFRVGIGENKIWRIRGNGGRGKKWKIRTNQK
jgi:hypothetical protein